MTLKGTFCSGKYGIPGVSIQVDDQIITSVTPKIFDKVFCSWPNSLIRFCLILPINILLTSPFHGSFRISHFALFSISDIRQRQSRRYLKPFMLFYSSCLINIMSCFEAIASSHFNNFKRFENIACWELIWVPADHLLKLVDSVRHGACLACLWACGYMAWK